MRPDDVAAFENVAGDVLAAARYEVRERARVARPTQRGRARIARYRAVTAAWRAAARAYQRSPLWRRTHPPLV
jgi:hypothetical protein